MVEMYQLTDTVEEDDLICKLYMRQPSNLSRQITKYSYEQGKAFSSNCALHVI